MESMAVAFPVKPGKAQEWRDPFAAWLRQHTLDLFEGFDLTNHHWKRSPSWPLMHRAWKMMKRGTAP